MYDSQTQSYMFRMREAVHISRQQLFLMREAVHISRQLPFQMREAVTHFAPTLFRLQKGTFHVIPTFHKNSLLRFHEHPSTFSTRSEWNIFPSTISTSRNSPILGQPRRYIYSIFYISTCCHLPFFWAVAIALFVIRFKNVVKVNDHHLGSYLVYSDISKYLTPNYTIFQTKKKFSNLYFIF